ncbi:hypothetical protein [Atopomonas sediminilitoris]|uniref:hypothetical protein n=1 Tax=Atopomonas sediminilitoris TaxID=2919919 RepID=UPI001F4E43AD|nr:hypothetical protein [Atopomonas sediminilitoris]MCJ8168379.1 hypothetical protein [Atopomonas sediminilitoris]
MTLLLKATHIVLACLGIILGITISFIALENYNQGRPDLAPWRFGMSVFLTLYASAQLVTAFKVKITSPHLFIFPTIYIFFAAFWEHSSRGYIKNWAPSPSGEAKIQNLICLTIIIATLIIATRSIIKTHRHKHN